MYGKTIGSALMATVPWVGVKCTCISYVVQCLLLAYRRLLPALDSTIDLFGGLAQQNGIIVISLQISNSDHFLANSES